MVEKDYSLDALNRFFDYAAEKGLLKRNTAHSRKLATNKILAALEDSEKVDLRKVEIDKAFDQFQNLQGTDYKPGSLQVYLSRMRSAFSDFFSYVDNPSTFKPSGGQRISTKRGNDEAKKSNNGGDNDKGKHGAQKEDPPPIDPSGIIIPIPIRDGVTVTVSGIPVDLTPSEGAKIAAIVKAYAVSIDDAD